VQQSCQLVSDQPALALYFFQHFGEGIPTQIKHLAARIDDAVAGGPSGFLRVAGVPAQQGYGVDHRGQFFPGLLA
jgi:hypothetical protein